MSYNYNELRGRIRAKFKTQRAFAVAMGMSECSLSKKLNNHEDWSRIEIERACDLLGIPLEKAHLYFFCVES